MFAILLLLLQIAEVLMAFASGDGDSNSGINATELITDFVDSLSLSPDVASQVTSALEGDPAVTAVLLNENLLQRSPGTVQAACDISRLIFGVDSITADDKIHADASKSW